ncbi:MULTISPECIES: hypothetical protein [Actinomadura]|uniref:Integral membrane protein n=2 Tax=Actinomadura yumaensis TaxID=111807 RepID=A0ABW2CK98_9ACTN|nr:hypothetical protein [Actinomadura sp. J1-007]MWK39979.1 hypothetical protein [Actinomadura sp. J1-007]
MLNTSDATTRLDDPRTREAFETAKKCVTLYGVVCAIVLATVVLLSISGQTVTAFMWIRAVVLLAAAPVLHRLTVRAAQGERRSYERVRAITVIMPIAIVGVDLIPGLCPAWYAVMQAIGALPLIAVAFLTRSPGPRAAFPKSS